MTRVIITDDMVEDAVVAHLRFWLPAYMADVETAVGKERGYYKRPPESSYLVRTDVDKWPEEMLPAVIVIAPGIEDDPLKSGNRKIRAKHIIGIATVVSSTDQENTRRYSYRIAAAVRMVMVDRPSMNNALDGQIRGVDWLGSRNGELRPDAADRTLWMNRQLFTVEVDNVFTKGEGPSAPYDPPVYEPEGPGPQVIKTTQTLEHT